MRPLLLVALLFLAACVSSQAEPGSPSNQPGSPQELRDVLATVRYIPLEGGFFGLVASDGRQYDPTNLGEEFQQDGLAVRATLRPMRGVVSFRMWGTIVEIVAMEKR